MNADCADLFLESPNLLCLTQAEEVCVAGGAIRVHPRLFVVHPRSSAARFAIAVRRIRGQPRLKARSYQASMLASSVVQRSMAGSPNSCSLGSEPTSRYPNFRL